ncbi:MAG: ModD protein [Arcobacteraceae bacterium]
MIFTDTELYEYIKEDLPYFDLTTSLQNSSNVQVSLEIYTREEIVLSCIEEAARIAVLLGCQVKFCLKSKEKAQKGEILLCYEGEYEKVHKSYKLIQVLLEYSCKISTRAYEMKKLIDEVNPNCELLTTRKTIPFAKKFCIKAILAGGAMPHRLGLSETILFFESHQVLYSTKEEFYNFLKQLSQTVSEKKIVVEAQSIEESKELMTCGVDVLQLDKLSVEEITEIVEYKNSNFPSIKILAAGGINISNVKQFAQAGVNAIVTSSVYICGMADLGIRMEKVKN